MKEEHVQAGQLEASAELAAIYANRFHGLTEYRRKVWETLTSRFFQKLIPDESAVVDLGCGYGEFINAVDAKIRYGMDLNGDSSAFLEGGVHYLNHDATRPWPIAKDSIDLVFTSNFFEHLPDKTALMAVFQCAYDALKPGGRLIAIGPNVRFLAGEYWDFWDHHIPLSERSLAEALRIVGFEIERMNAQFLPYTMSGVMRPPVFLLRLYLMFPIIWRLFGKQFLVVARKRVDSRLTSE